MQILHCFQRKLFVSIAPFCLEWKFKNLNWVWRMWPLPQFNWQFHDPQSHSAIISMKINWWGAIQENSKTRQKTRQKLISYHWKILIWKIKLIRSDTASSETRCWRLISPAQYSSMSASIYSRWLLYQSKINIQYSSKIFTFNVGIFISNIDTKYQCFSAPTYHIRFCYIQ